MIGNLVRSASYGLAQHDHRHAEPSRRRIGRAVSGSFLCCCPKTSSQVRYMRVEELRLEFPQMALGFWQELCVNELRNVRAICAETSGGHQKPGWRDGSEPVAAAEWGPLGLASPAGIVSPCDALFLVAQLWLSPCPNRCWQEARPVAPLSGLKVARCARAIKSLWPAPPPAGATNATNIGDCPAGLACEARPASGKCASYLSAFFSSHRRPTSCPPWAQL